MAPSKADPAGFFPREHGATAMLLIPFVAAAILARTFRVQELAAFIAVFVVFAAKDPLVVLARQRWVWRQPHAETQAAIGWLAAEAICLAACGFALVATGPLVAYSLLFVGAAGFSVLAVWVNLRNRQRSVAFQVASAAALTSTSLTAALAATNGLPPWCWWLWTLLAVQASAGIFTVHARLDARIAIRKGLVENHAKNSSRRTAWAFSSLLAAGGLAAALFQIWIAGGLLLAALAYALELRRQRDPQSLNLPLTMVGLQSLALSVAYTALVVAGLW